MPVPIGGIHGALTENILCGGMRDVTLVQSLCGCASKLPDRTCVHDGDDTRNFHRLSVQHTRTAIHNCTGAVPRR